MGGACVRLVIDHLLFSPPSSPFVHARWSVAKVADDASVHANRRGLWVCNYVSKMIPWFRFIPVNADLLIHQDGLESASLFRLRDRAAACACCLSPRCCCRSSSHRSLCCCVLPDRCTAAPRPILCLFPHRVLLFSAAMSTVASPPPSKPSPNKSSHSNAQRPPKADAAAAASPNAAAAGRASSSVGSGDDKQREKSRKLDTKHGFVKQVRGTKAHKHSDGG